MGAIQHNSFGLDVVDIIRSFFLFAGAAVILIFLVPALRDRFLAYGARSSSYGTPSAQQEKDAQRQSRQNASSLLDTIQTWRVPHSWFTTFYAVSVGLSILWLIVLPLFRQYLENLTPYLDSHRPQTPFSRQSLAMVLLLVQGARRLTECIVLQSTSSSTMWVGHWLLGMGFYIGISVAIWIEGVRTLLVHHFTIADVEIAAPSLRASIAILLFTFASGIQHDCHAYLASLKTSKTTRPEQVNTGIEHRGDVSRPQYQMPSHPAFSLVLTPHYLAECFIYLALTILTAPEGCWLNITLLCATAFVVVNLGVTAIGTRAWYARTFGQKAVQGKAAMIPFLL